MTTLLIYIFLVFSYCNFAQAQVPHCERAISSTSFLFVLLKFPSSGAIPFLIGNKCDLSIKTIATSTTPLPNPTHLFVGDHATLQCDKSSGNPVEFYKGNTLLSLAEGWMTVGNQAARLNRHGLAKEDSGSYYCMASLQGKPCLSSSVTWFVSKDPPKISTSPFDANINIADGNQTRNATVCLKNSKDVGPLSSFYTTWEHSSIELLRDFRFRQLFHDNCSTLEITGNNQDLIGNLTFTINSGTAEFSAEAKFVLFEAILPKATSKVVTATPALAVSSAPEAGTHSTLPTSKAPHFPETRSTLSANVSSNITTTAAKSDKPPSQKPKQNVTLVVLLWVVGVALLVVLIVLLVWLCWKKSRQRTLQVEKSKTKDTCEEGSDPREAFGGNFNCGNSESNISDSHITSSATQM